MAEVEPAPEPAPEYYEYVQPYHHERTTKHGARNWSWTLLWERKCGLVPLCCPCENDSQNGDLPHVMTRVVGAHVKLKKREDGDGDPTPEVPAIIPVCSGCNTGNKEFLWNSKAILLRNKEHFFGKLYLLEQKGGSYWEEVHSVTHINDYTYVKGRVKTDITIPNLSKRKLIKEYQNELQQIYNKNTLQDLKAHLGPNAPRGVARNDIISELGAFKGVGTRFVGKDITGRPGPSYDLPKSIIDLSDENSGNDVQTNGWKYRDDTKFVYDLLRPPEGENVILTCKHSMGRGNNFTQDVIDQVPGVEAGPENGNRMPDIQEQIIHNFLHQVEQHTVEIQDILRALLSRYVEEPELLTDMMGNLNLGN